MLSNIKYKFLNVSKNVIFSQNDKKEERPVNFEAGSEILDYFQNEWSLIHHVSENNAKKADEMAKEIENLHIKIKRTEKNMEFIVRTLTNSNLTNSIIGAHQKINDLLNLCETIEKDLIEFERSIDENEFQNMKKRHEYHLTKYEERKAGIFQQ